MSVNMCRAYDGARNEEAPHDAALFEAWCTVRVVKAWHCCLHSVCAASVPICAPALHAMATASISQCLQGRTGYPMVDAVVRCLLRGGWINFRMRAMIFSFAAYNLWLHWCAWWAVWLVWEGALTATCHAE